MKILLLTSIYPAEDLPKTYTPVVHYFTREWAKTGNEVKVVHSQTAFPKIFYSFARMVGTEKISSIFGTSVPKNSPRDKKYKLEGVDVARFCMRKAIPHSNFSKKQIDKQVLNITDYCAAEKFEPDLIVGHWANPQLELVSKLKKHFPHAKTALTLHESPHIVKKLHPKDWKDLIESIDKIGGRNIIQEKKIRSSLNLDDKKTYVCVSGIPNSFIQTQEEHIFTDSMQNYIFVGTFFKRKYPEKIIEAALINNDFKNLKISYIGAGDQESKIRELVKENNLRRNVEIIGRIPRDKIKKYLKSSDCFIMISKNEIFGLVYLEAMAQGCIAIASKNEGFDGIIKDGENGFLCEAGNEKELSNILTKIKSLPRTEIMRISKNAQKTAISMSDSNCAKMYLEELLS